MTNRVDGMKMITRSLWISAFFPPFPSEGATEICLWAF